MTDRRFCRLALTNAPANCLRASKADDTRLRVITFACWGFRCSVNKFNGFFLKTLGWYVTHPTFFKKVCTLTLHLPAFYEIERLYGLLGYYV